jgi:hypothetical protein
MGVRSVTDSLIVGMGAARIRHGIGADAVRDSEEFRSRFGAGGPLPAEHDSGGQRGPGSGKLAAIEKIGE